MIKKYLLADDDQDDTELFHEALKTIDDSIEFHSVPNGKELISRLGSDDVPEIIFLDINMPEMDGWECLAELKKHKSLKRIPVVMYSTSPASLDGKKAINSGAICFLEKPSSYLKLKDFLERIATASESNLVSILRSIEVARTHNLVVA